MAATYFKLSGSKTGEIVTTSNDSRSKKFCMSANHNVVIDSTLAPADEVNTITQVTSLEFPTNRISLNNIFADFINRSTLLTGALNSVMIDYANPAVLPSFGSSLVIGLSNADCSGITDIDTFMTLQKVTYPISYKTKIATPFTLQLNDKKCEFDTHRLFINVLSSASTSQTGDVVDFWTYANTLTPAGYTLGSIKKNLRIVIDGVVE